MGNTTRSPLRFVLLGVVAVGALLFFLWPWWQGGGWFTDVTESAGIGFTHTNGATGKHRYVETVGAGVALFDYDGDGWLDVYFVNGNLVDEPPSDTIRNALYRNNRDGTFTDVTATAGVGDTGYGQGCCAADYDDDGDVDLYVTNFGPDRLFRNDGNGRFTDVTAAAGINNPLFGQTVAFFDYDGDGDLDIYVQNYVTYDPARQQPRRDYATPMDFAGAPDLLFRNEGNGRFSEVSRAAGIHNADGRGMGAVCVDLDGDRDPDLFVANDAMENYYYVNNGDGTFADHSIRSGLAYDQKGRSQSSMGADVGDLDGDGRPDIVCPALRAEGCTIYRNQGTQFEDVSGATRALPATSRFTGFSPNLLDADNDGDLDLFVCNGGVATTPGVSIDAPYTKRYGNHDVLLLNDGKGRFDPAGEVAGPHFARELIGRGSAAGDIDNDGDIDIVVANLAGRPAVLRNDAPQGNWITLNLRLANGNRDAIGTKIRVTAGGRTQWSVVRATGGYLSLNDRRPHFGLGAAARIDEIAIEWPDGGKQTLTNVAANRFVDVEQE